MLLVSETAWYNFISIVQGQVSILQSLHMHSYCCTYYTAMLHSSVAHGPKYVKSLMVLGNGAYLELVI